jgi:hypothetical protein
MELLLNDAEVKRKRGTYEVTNFKCAAFVTMLLCVENHCQHNSIVDLMLEEHKNDVDINIVMNELNCFHGVYPNNPTGHYILSLENPLDCKALRMLMKSFRNSPNVFRNIKLDGTEFKHTLDHACSMTRGALTFDLVYIADFNTMVPNQNVLGVKAIDKLVKIMEFNQLSNLIEKSNVEQRNFRAIMENRVSNDAPADVHGKMNLLDQNCTLNRARLNRFRCTIEIFKEPCVHDHQMNEACFPSCRLHPYNRHYPSKSPNVKMNYIDTLTGAMINKFTNQAIMATTRLRAYLSKHSLILSIDLLEMLFEECAAPYNTCLKMYGFKLYTHLLFATFSRMENLNGIFSLCKKYMDRAEFNYLVQVFGQDIINKYL